MLLRRLTCCLAALLLALGAGAVRAQAQVRPGATPGPGVERAVTQYLLDTWTTEQGLPVNTVNAVHQTQDGYLWFGTQEGLVRFNGRAMRVFDKRTANLPSSTISVLFEDDRGRLWIGTRGGGVLLYEDERFTIFGEAAGLQGLQISGIAQDRDGGIWVSTMQRGLYRFQGSRFAAYRAEDGLPSDNINALLADRSGNLWIGTRDSGLVRFSNGQFNAFSTRDGLPTNDISALFEDSRGGLWIGTRNGGLSVLRDGSIHTYTSREGLPSNTVLAVEEDAAGDLWIGTELGGLTRLRDGRFETLNAEHGLADNTVFSLLRDREGGLWAGTQNGGVSRLYAGKFVNFTTTEGLARDFVFSITQDTRGDMWFGTWEGGVSRLRDGEITTYRTEDGLPSDIILSVYGTRDGSVWAGTRRAGLARFSDGGVTTYTAEDGLPDESIYSLFEDSEGSVWIGTGRGGLVRYRNGRFTTLTTEDGLSSNGITALAEDADGNLWVGTYDGGLNQIRDGRVVAHYGTEEGLLSDYVLSLYADPAGGLWIGTREGGLHRLREGEMRAISVEDGLFNDKIAQILDDGQGSLWMSCNKGIFRVSKDELNAFADGETDQVTSIAYDANDGLPTNELNGGTQPAGWRSQDGRLWFPSNKGVVSIDPANIPVNEVPPKVVVEAVLAGAEDVPVEAEASLAPGNDRVQFHYAGLSFIAPEEVTYRYKLQGVDDDWVDAGTRREAFYTNLPPGPYTFLVQARNSDGVWSETQASFSFYLEPFFWQTTWFYLLCAFGLAVSSFGAYRWRVHQLTVRQRELEETVEARTRDLREEKEKTEAAKVTIEQQAEKLRELDKMKTQFFSNISHEFRTPLTLNIGPLENALGGLYGPINPQMRKQIEIMLRNSRRLLRLINQLLDISKLEMGRMKLRLQHGDLMSLLSGVVSSFSAFLEKKGTALELEADREAISFYFDSGSIEKVIYNLLSNAMKFTPDGGRITVKVRELPPEEEGAPERVEVRVADTGCGIPADDLPYIFDRFHQAKGSVSTVQEGTGIGLSLVKELVELHGGEIWAESVVGEGTEFIFWLPKAAAPAEEAPVPDSEKPPELRGTQSSKLEMAVFEAQAEASASSGDGAEGADLAPEVEEGQEGAPDERPEILVVDDNPDLRAYMTSCLEGRYRVRTAVNGRDALEKLREKEPYLVVSDLMMPEMNGYELCREIRRDETLRHIPMIMVTSKASLDHKIEGLEAGVDDYLTKPFNAEELHARVRNLLKMRSHEKALVDTNFALTEAIEVKSQILRIAAHDLRNPLNNIREFAKIVRMEIPEDAEAGELLDLIEKSSNHMFQLITQMLEAEKLESGAFELEMGPLDVNEMMGEIVARNRRQAEAKEQEILFERLEDGCIVEGSAEWLNEAVENLVTNAIKYSPPQKRIWIAVQREEEAVVLSVRDEGPGLTEDDKAKLFQKFTRLSARPTGGESSTGLGLSIVKHIVELHEGSVWAESELGAGSTFKIRLPAVPEPVRA